MAPPKPSQRGKFRPKKPQKKANKPSASSGTTSLPSSSPSTTTTPDEGSNIRRNESAIEVAAGRWRGRGGRDRGRGRGGRGRGRIPIPQGTVFFTGKEKKQPAVSAKGPSTKRASVSVDTNRARGQSRKGNDTIGNRSITDTSTEEVVGELDTAIGGSGNSKKKPILERDFDDYVDEEGPSRDVGGSAHLHVSTGCMYDSDSSDERSMRHSENLSLIPPLELPFTTKTHFTGVTPDVAISDRLDTQNIGEDLDPIRPAAPFATSNETEAVHGENTSWFLVQLPTRLPPMLKNASRHENVDENLEEIELEDNTATMGQNASPSATDNLMNNLSEVAVAPIITGSFDNGLDKNFPGRIGKIVVYKSGKTSLVMDGPDDKITMDVHEGLTCAFYQQAIAVNAKEGHFITLGDVEKSIIISPDLTSI